MARLHTEVTDWPEPIGEYAQPGREAQVTSNPWEYE